MRTIPDSGLVLDGTKINAPTVTRREALASHTADNAKTLLNEKELGSIETDKFDDFLVLDRNYLTMSAEQIDHIHPGRR